MNKVVFGTDHQKSDPGGGWGKTTTTKKVNSCKAIKLEKISCMGEPSPLRFRGKKFVQSIWRQKNFCKAKGVEKISCIRKMSHASPITFLMVRPFSYRLFRIVCLAPFVLLAGSGSDRSRSIVWISCYCFFKISTVFALLCNLRVASNTTLRNSRLRDTRNCVKWSEIY